jgi:hypothetical protein
MSDSAAIPHTFETLSDAISYVFRQEQTSLLSLDRICEGLQSPILFINWKREGTIPTSQIPRRRISSTLSSSELFVKAGPPRDCMWAIRPHNPLFLSDGAISSSIEQMLTNNGPMTLDQLVHTSQLTGADTTLYERFLTEHTSEFTCASDETYWFTNQPRPNSRDFETITHALVYALSAFPEGASVEEVNWFLCLSTVDTSKTITRRIVSRELSRHPSIFENLARARYKLVNPEASVQPSPGVGTDVPKVPIVRPSFPVPIVSAPQDPLPRHTEDDEFDPFSFFNREFPFSFD